MSDVQKSEVHNTTADGSSADAPEPQKMTHPGETGSADRDELKVRPEVPPDQLDALYPKGTHVVRDDSDLGGPIELVTDETDGSPTDDR